MLRRLAHIHPLQASVLKYLAIHKEGCIKGASIPNNLTLMVSYVTNRDEALKKLLTAHPLFKTGSVIVYCTKQAVVDNVATQLRAGGVEAESYHAGIFI